MIVVRSYFYNVVYTQQGCHNLKLKLNITVCQKINVNCKRNVLADSALEQWDVAPQPIAEERTTTLMV